MQVRETGRVYLPSGQLSLGAVKVALALHGRHGNSCGVVDGKEQALSGCINAQGVMDGAHDPLLGSGDVEHFENRVDDF